VLKKGEQLDFMPRSQVADRLLGNMQAWYKVIVREGGQEEEYLHKGMASSIDIYVKKRQGKKVVTIIEGLETFLISPQRFAEEMQVKCASSSTTNELQQSTPKKPLHEVVVQGNQVPICTKELMEHYGIPKQSIVVLK
jgi:translation initiation factor 2D